MTPSALRLRAIINPPEVGILAIGAALHGARGIDAVDIDPAAVQATEANAQANGVTLADLDLGGGFGINRQLRLPSDMAKFGDYPLIQALDIAAKPSAVRSSTPT